MNERRPAAPRVQVSPRRPDARTLAARSAPVLAAIGLLVAALITVTFWRTPLLLGGGGRAGASAEVNRHTPLPAGVVSLAPNVSLPGQVVFVKTGDLWLLSGPNLTHVTHGGNAAMPAWSPDGRWIYYIETRVAAGRWPPSNPTTFTLTYPVLVRVHPDGTGKEDVLSGLFQKQPNLQYFFWIREPSISPDGKTAAVITDWPNPDTQSPSLGFIDLTAGKFVPAPPLPLVVPFGHTSPAYSADGASIAYVMEGRSASGVAEPSLWIYDVASGKGKQLSQAGYRFPSWSPDGRYIAATRDINQKLDIVILDASTGREVASVTHDGASQMPVWAPSGNELLFLHMAGPVADIDLARFTENAGAFTFEPIVAVTQNTGVEQTSRPAWYIPAS